MSIIDSDPKDNLFAVVVGTGFIGPVHVEALRRLGRPVLGMLGSSLERTRTATEVLNISRAYHSLDEVLADPAVQVVHLASPNRLHYEQCKQVLAAGKHVLCEKPLALTTRETAELCERASKSDVVAALCYNIRFYPLCHEVRARIQRGDLGTIYHVTGSYLQDWLLHENDFNWRVLADEGGALRAVADIGTHWMDLITWMTDLEPAQVCADLHTALPTRQRPKSSVETFQSKVSAPVETESIRIDTEDYGSVLMRFRGGGRGQFTVSQVAAGRKNCLRFEIAGSKGNLAWNSESPNELWIGHRDRANELLVRDPALLDENAKSRTNFPGGHNEGFPDTFKQLFRTVYDYIEAGDKSAPRRFPTFEDGHREALLCEAILMSHREHRWVALN